MSEGNQMNEDEIQNMLETEVASLTWALAKANEENRELIEENARLVAENEEVGRENGVFREILNEQRGPY